MYDDLGRFFGAGSIRPASTRRRRIVETEVVWPVGLRCHWIVWGPGFLTAETFGLWEVHRSSHGGGPRGDHVWSHVVGERVVNNAIFEDRDSAMVSQKYALYPHMSGLKTSALR